jgi:CheY-like chemotaxis protein
VPFAPSFLIIDLNPDGLSLLSRTLARKFPHAKIHECTNAEECVSIAKNQKLDAIVVHRTFETTGEDTVRLLREANPVVPIVMVSGIERRESAIAAGASAFLLYDKWLLLGPKIAELINAPDSRTPWTSESPSG